MKKVQIILIVLSLSGIVKQSVSQTIKWAEKSIHGSNNQSTNDVAADGAGKSYVAGHYKTQAIFNPASTITSTNSDGTGIYEDGFFAKYDRLGNYVWKLDFKNTSSSTTNERVSAVAVYPDGLGSFNVYVVGIFSGNITIPTTSGSPVTFTGGIGIESFVAKYNANGVLTWANKINGSGNDVANDLCVNSDGSGGVTVFIAGYFTGSAVTYNDYPALSSINGDQEGFLIRVNDSGTFQWARILSSVGSDSYNAVASDLNGDVTVVGTLASTGVVHTNNTSTTTAATCWGNTDAIITHYTISGAFGWITHCGSYTSGAGNYDGGTSVTIDINGTVYVAGYYTGNFYIGMWGPLTNLGTGWDFFLVQLTSSGAVNWFRKGGTANDGDIINSIAVNNLAHRLYCTGNFKGNYTYDGSSTLFSSHSATNLDGFLLTLNADDLTRISGGETKFGGSSHDDYGNSIAINAAEDLFLAGTSLSASWTVGSTFIYNNDNASGGTSDCYLLKWDHSNWPNLSSTSEYAAINKGIGEWHDGGVGYNRVLTVGALLSATTVTFPGVTGLTSTPGASTAPSNDAYLLRSNTYGNNDLFVKLMDGSAEEEITGAVVDWQGYCYYTGQSHAPFSTTNTARFVGGPSYSFIGPGAGFIGLCDKSGNYQWGLHIQNTANVQPMSITIDNFGYVYVCGYYNGSNPVIPTTSGSPITLPASVVYLWNGFVAKYHYTGALQWAKSFPVTSTNPNDGIMFNSISVDNTGNYYVTGDYRANNSFALGANTLPISSGYDLFVMKGSTSTGLATKSMAVSTAADDLGFGIISPNPDEIYLTGNIGGTVHLVTLNNVLPSYNGKTYTASINFTPASPSINWSKSSTAGSGYATAYGKALQLINGYVYVTGQATSSGILAFGSFSNTVSSGNSFMTAYSSWNGAETCVSIFPNPNPWAMIAESGELSADHGDNLLITGGGSIAFTQKISSEGCVSSERIAQSTNEENKIGKFNSTLIFPNPFSAETTLQINSSDEIKNAMLIIFDLSGRITKEINNINAHQIQISSDGLVDGVYLYQITQEGKSIGTGKMIISR
jgi:hypothetical protein